LVLGAVQLTDTEAASTLAPEAAAVARSAAMIKRDRSDEVACERVLR
jgi:hypothetical protein